LPVLYNSCAELGHDEYSVGSEEKKVQKMLVAQLKEELKARDASTEGKKPELCARLTALLHADAADAEPTSLVDTVRAYASMPQI
jgi:hypothetical protein